MVIQNWYPATTAPRTAFGAISYPFFQGLESRKGSSEGLLTDMYRMTMAEMNPTPRPQMTRPAHMRPRPVEAVSRMQPTMKIKQPEMMVVRRPMKSAMSPAMRAPRKVPRDRMEVVRD